MASHQREDFEIAETIPKREFSKYDIISSGAKFLHFVKYAVRTRIEFLFFN